MTLTPLREQPRKLAGWHRAIEKLERLTIKAGPDECWLWSGYTQPNGYGWVNVYGLRISAHRLALINSGVDVPDGMDACHRCDVRNCVNPAHLYAGTRSENMADCSARGRHNKPIGERHWRAKLTAAQVADLRRQRQAGVRVAALAAAFGINTGTVSRIARGIWRTEVA